MASIFDFFRRLFSRRPAPARQPAVSFGAPEAATEVPAAAPPPDAGPEPAPEPLPEPSPAGALQPPSGPEAISVQRPGAEPDLTAAAGGGDEADNAGEDDGDDEAAADEADDEEEEEPDDLPPDEELDDDDPLAPDPFVSPDAPTIEPLSPDAVSQQRAEAMAVALTGEHRVFLAEAAGPGTLAEALNLLAQQGKVAAEFCDDEAEGPYLLYRVVEPAADQPPPSAL